MEFNSTHNLHNLPTAYIAQHSTYVHYKQQQQKQRTLSELSSNLLLLPSLLHFLLSTTTTATAAGNGCTRQRRTKGLSAQRESTCLFDDRLVDGLRRSVYLDHVLSVWRG